MLDTRAVLTGLGSLQNVTLGDPGVCVAVPDGPVDLSHPCFAGANIRRLDTLVQDPAGQGPVSLHGTHVASDRVPRAGVGPRQETGLRRHRAPDYLWQVIRNPESHRLPRRHGGLVEHPPQHRAPDAPALQLQQGGGAGSREVTWCTDQDGNAMASPLIPLVYVRRGAPDPVVSLLLRKRQGSRPTYINARSRSGVAT